VTKIKKTILVTGENGFLGSNLIAHLKIMGYEVFGLGCDIKLFDDVLAKMKIVKPSVVFHFAGISQTTVQDEDAVNLVNVEGTRNICRALVRVTEKPQLFLASSCAVYAPYVKENLAESSPIGPSSPYGQSKLRAEQMIIRDFPDVACTSLRLFNVTGRGQSTAFIVPKIIDAFSRKLETISLGNTSAVREFNDVRDFVCICEALLWVESLPVVLNLGSSIGHSIDTIISKLMHLTGHNISVLSDSSLYRDAEKNRVVSDCTKIDAINPGIARRSLENTLLWMLEERVEN
jgi:nucleoside-diphosphate-sugar epimerase